MCDECGKDFARSQNVDLHKTKRLCDPSQKVERDDYEDDGFVSEVALKTMTPYEKVIIRNSSCCLYVTKVLEIFRGF